MAKFEKNSWGYEIDFYNNGTESEKKFLSSLYSGSISCYYKEGSEWVQRISGMTFRLNGMNYYPKLKEYLDYRLNIHLRKEKLKKINEFYEANQ